MGFKGLCCVLGVVSSVACAFDRAEDADYATPALEQGMDSEGVYSNAEQTGNCLEKGANAAEKVCGGGESKESTGCREKQMEKNRSACERSDVRTERGERSFRMGGEAKADRRGPSAGGGMEFKSK